jgi:hypothetical protein
MKTAAEWRRFYEAERASLGEAGLAARLDQARADVGCARLEARAGVAPVFPHTMLAASGHFVAAAALAVVRSGADEVLALGVLHGARERDAALVQAARDGDAGARATLRRVHTADAPWCAEEFSLDGFAVLLVLAARREGRPPPRLHARFPFLVGLDGADPATVPGVDELARMAERMPVVATTDPIHHGAGYGTPPHERRSEDDDATRAWARGRIESQLAALAGGGWNEFARLANEVRSDFRDDGPVLAHLLRAGGPRGGRDRLRGDIAGLALVDYSAALGADRPTWVAAPLMTLAVDAAP